MSVQAALPLEYDLLGRLPVQVEAVEELVTSDVGQLRFSHAGSEHRFVEMVRQRVFGILADYPDQNDHDTLRAEGLFKIIAGRRPDDRAPASQPTLLRMENAVTAGDPLRVKAWFLEQFVATFGARAKTATRNSSAS